VSAKPTLKPPVVPSAFLEGAAGAAVTAPKPGAVQKVPAAPKIPELTLTDVEIEATKLVSLKIPLKMYEDIDTLRRNSNITLTDIFVKSAAPQVARLIEELRKKQGK
jgi:hypothetical protein